MRTSQVITKEEQAGSYEIEVFDCAKPTSVIICSHGNGVRRWDGENFFYNVVEHYPGSAFLLVDQNQVYKDGCKLNDLQIMVDRVQGLVTKAKADYPGVPIIVMGHSMGCGAAARLSPQDVSKMIFVAPTAGDETAKLLRRYGPDILAGQEVKSSDGLTKFVSKEFVDSVQSVVWEEEYKKLLTEFSAVHVFEAGKEELVSEERFKHRDMPFETYTIIPGATHNVHGQALQDLFVELDRLI
jgi:pimeloyl-ACP methyl ester carboxylesterase